MKKVRDISKHQHFKNSAAPAVTPQPAEQQSVVVLIVTPIEADKIFTGLGKLPAESVEELRTKVKTQAGQQRELVKSFYQQPSVQELIAEDNANSEPSEPQS